MNSKQDSRIVTSDVRSQAPSLTGSPFTLLAIICESNNKRVVFLLTVVGIEPSHGDEVLIRVLLVYPSSRFISPDSTEEDLRASTFVVLVMALGMSWGMVKSLVFSFPTYHVL